jgi:NAD(P)-dependent dehydrogenase (short-subunit alcohol dehydrogenase family)
MHDTIQDSMVYATYPDLAGKRVVITGGGSGIGGELTAAFAGQGARVWFIDIAEEASLGLAASLASAAHPPRFLKCDLTDIQALKATFAAIEQDAGGVDILINNAANDERHAIEDVSPAYWDDRMAVNLRHQFFCSQAVIPGTKQRGHGVILNFGSISWHLPHTQLDLYMTAKAGIEGMTRGMAREFGRFGIRANVVVPGAVRTPRQQALWHDAEEEARILAGQCIPECVEMQDVAALTLFLASNSARRCTGRAYFVDNGWYGA